MGVDILLIIKHAWLIDLLVDVVSCKYLLIFVSDAVEVWVLNELIGCWTQDWIVL